MLRVLFKPRKYGLVILPIPVLKRFHDCLLPNHDAVLNEYKSKKNFAVIDGFLTKALGYGELKMNISNRLKKMLNLRTIKHLRH